MCACVRSCFDPLMRFYFCWNSMKNSVSQMEPKTIKELRTCVVRAVGMINRDDLQKAVDGYKRRLELCIAHNGYRFEHAR